MHAEAEVAVRNLPTILVLVALCLPIACTKEGKQASLPGAPPQTAAPAPAGADATSPSGNAAPVVTAAVVVPTNPTAEGNLGLQYEGQSPDNGPITYRFRWIVDNSLVQDGPDSNLAPGSYRKGASVYVEVIPSAASGTGPTFRTAPVTIGNTPPAITMLVIKPSPAYAGIVLTAVPTVKDLDGDRVSCSYQWKVNGANAAGSTQDETFDTKGLHKRDVVSVRAVPSDGEASGIPVEAKTTLQNSPPQITSTAPAAQSGGIYTYQITAEDPDADAIIYSLVTAPPGMTIDRETGLVRWELPITLTEKQEVTVKVSADDRDGGVAYQEFSLFLQLQ
jgi:hypothetical protein